MISNTWDKGVAMLLIAVLHVICCGLPILLLSGGSLAFLAPLWPTGAVILGLLGVAGSVGYYWRRRCDTCVEPPRHENWREAHEGL